MSGIPVLPKQKELDRNFLTEQMRHFASQSQKGQDGIDEQIRQLVYSRQQFASFAEEPLRRMGMERLVKEIEEMEKKYAELPDEELSSEKAQKLMRDLQERRLRANILGKRLWESMTFDPVTGERIFFFEHPRCQEFLPRGVFNDMCNALECLRRAFDPETRPPRNQGLASLIPGEDMHGNKVWYSYWDPQGKPLITMSPNGEITCSWRTGLDKSALIALQEISIAQHGNYRIQGGSSKYRREMIKVAVEQGTWPYIANPELKLKVREMAAQHINFSATLHAIFGTAGLDPKGDILQQEKSAEAAVRDSLKHLQVMYTTREKELEQISQTTGRHPDEIGQDYLLEALQHEITRQERFLRKVDEAGGFLLATQLVQKEKGDTPAQIMEDCRALMRRIDGGTVLNLCAKEWEGCKNAVAAGIGVVEPDTRVDALRASVLLPLMQQLNAGDELELRARLSTLEDMYTDELGRYVRATGDPALVETYERYSALCAKLVTTVQHITEEQDKTLADGTYKKDKYPLSLEERTRLAMLLHNDPSIMDLTAATWDIYRKCYHALPEEQRQAFYSTFQHCQMELAHIRNAAATPDYAEMQERLHAVIFNAKTYHGQLSGLMEKEHEFTLDGTQYKVHVAQMETSRKQREVPTGKKETVTDNKGNKQVKQLSETVTETHIESCHLILLRKVGDDDWLPIGDFRQENHLGYDPEKGRDGMVQKAQFGLYGDSPAHMSAIQAWAKSGMLGDQELETTTTFQNCNNSTKIQVDIRQIQNPSEKKPEKDFFAGYPCPLQLDENLGTYGHTRIRETEYTENHRQRMLAFEEKVRAELPVESPQHIMTVTSPDMLRKQIFAHIAEGYAKHYAEHPDAGTYAEFAANTRIEQLRENLQSRFSPDEATEEANWRHTIAEHDLSHERMRYIPDSEQLPPVAEYLKEGMGNIYKECAEEIMTSTDENAAHSLSAYLLRHLNRHLNVPDADAWREMDEGTRTTYFEQCVDASLEILHGLTERLQPRELEECAVTTMRQVEYESGKEDVEKIGTFDNNPLPSNHSTVTVENGVMKAVNPANGYVAREEQHMTNQESKNALIDKDVAELNRQKISQHKVEQEAQMYNQHMK